MWLDSSPEGGGAKLPFPTPAMVMANFCKWFPDLKDSTRELNLTLSLTLALALTLTLSLTLTLTLY